MISQKARYGLHTVLDSKPKGKLVFRQVPRQFPLGANRPQGADELEPLRYQSCKNWSWWQRSDTGTRHKRTCNRCRDCRNFKHERIVSQAIAECVTSSVVLSLTLTYADIDFAQLASEAIGWIEESEADFQDALNDDWPSQTRINIAHRELEQAQSYLSDIQSEAEKVGAYRDGEYQAGKVAPAGALRLDYRHIELFLKRLRKAGYEFKKVAAGEYGGDLGRAHWHLLLMFDHDEATKAQVLEAVANNEDWSRIQPLGDWQQNAVPFVANLRGQDFQDAIADPDMLVVSYPQSGHKTPKIRNTAWRFWPHGIVQGEIAKAPGFNHPEQIEGAVRYPMKYLSKDAWKDSRKYQKTPFEELPEHIRQQTKFGPWKDKAQIAAEWQKSVDLGERDAGQVPQLGEDWRKWSYGNPYVKRLEKELIEEFATPEEIPLERQLCKGLYNYKSRGGMGSAYFEALGRQVCRNWKSDQSGRGFQLGANYRNKRTNADRIKKTNWKGTASAGSHQLFVNQETGETVLAPRQRFNHVMGDTSYKSFWRGYNLELKSEGKAATAGPDDVVETLETAKANASDSSSGSFGYHWWKRLSRSSRQSVEQSTADVPNRELKGLFPMRWIKSMEETSDYLGWRVKGLERLRIEYLRSLERIQKEPAKLTDQTGNKDVFLMLRVKTEEALALTRKKEWTSDNPEQARQQLQQLKRYRQFVEHHIARSPELDNYWPHGWLICYPKEEPLEEWHLPKPQSNLKVGDCRPDQQRKEQRKPAFDLGQRLKEQRKR